MPPKKLSGLVYRKGSWRDNSSILIMFIPNLRLNDLAYITQLVRAEVVFIYLLNVYSFLRERAWTGGSREGTEDLKWALHWQERALYRAQTYKPWAVVQCSTDSHPGALQRWYLNPGNLAQTMHFLPITLFLSFLHQNIDALLPIKSKLLSKYFFAQFVPIGIHFLSTSTKQ